MYHLESGSWSATVIPEFGMNLIRLRHGNKDLVRSPINEEALRKSPYLYGFPLLFPANRTKNGTFSFQGKQYQLPVNELPAQNNLHGVMVDASFEILYAKEDEICARYQNRGERYPFSFDMTIVDSLSESGYQRSVQILALQDMPYTLAFHATFPQPKTYQIPLGDRYLRDTNHIPTGETVPFRPSGHIISNYYRSIGQTVVLDEFSFTVSENFDHWVLYNGNGKMGFLCVEPQCGEVNGLNTEGHRVLLAGENETFTLRFEKNTP